MASAVSLIKAAVSDKTVPGSRLLSAILALEKSKQPVRSGGLSIRTVQSALYDPPTN